MSRGPDVQFFFEGHKIARARVLLPENCRKVSTRANLIYLEQRGWLASATDVERRAIRTGRNFSQFRFPLGLLQSSIRVRQVPPRTHQSSRSAHFEALLTYRPKIVRMSRSMHTSSYMPTDDSGKADLLEHLAVALPKLEARVGRPAAGRASRDRMDRRQRPWY